MKTALGMQINDGIISSIMMTVVDVVGIIFLMLLDISSSSSSILTKLVQSLQRDIFLSRIIVLHVPTS